MLSDRLATARRLELSGAVEAGDRVEGTYRGVKVALEDHGLERTLHFDLGCSVRWVRVGLRFTEINDPDVVTTGDARFDDVVSVLAEDGAAPAVSGVFEAPELRAALRDFFQRFMNAEIQGRTLRVPHLGLENAETSVALDLGSKLARDLRRAIELAPPASFEPQPVLARTVSPPPAREAAEPMEGVEPSESQRLKNGAVTIFGVLGLGVAGISLAFFRDAFMPIMFVGSALMAVLLYRLTSRP